jgi:hypothetical protein
MTRGEGQLLHNWDDSAGYWQYHSNRAGYEREQFHKQAKQNADDTTTILLWIIGTISLLVLLVVAGR